MDGNEGMEDDDEEEDESGDCNILICGNDMMQPKKK